MPGRPTGRRRSPRQPDRFHKGNGGCRAAASPTACGSGAGPLGSSMRRATARARRRGGSSIERAREDRLEERGRARRMTASLPARCRDTAAPAPSGLSTCSTPTCQRGLAHSRFTGEDERRWSVLDLTDERRDGTELRFASHHPSHTGRRILHLRAERRRGRPGDEGGHEWPPSHENARGLGTPVGQRSRPGS